MKTILCVLLFCLAIFAWYYLTNKKTVTLNDYRVPLTILSFNNLPIKVQNGFLSVQKDLYADEKIFCNIDAKNKIRWIENTTRGYHNSPHQELETKKYILVIIMQRSWPMVIFEKKLYYIELQSGYKHKNFRDNHYLVKEDLMKCQFVVFDIAKYL